MNKVTVVLGLSFAVIGLAFFSSTTQSAAGGSFVLPSPDLTPVDACVRKSRGNKVAAADCFDPYLAICQNKYSSRMSECLPQESEFWRKTVDYELSRISRPIADQVTASIRGDIAEHCNFDVLQYQEGCRRMVYHQAAVYLRIARLWK